MYHTCILCVVSMVIFTCDLADARLFSTFFIAYADHVIFVRVVSLANIVTPKITCSTVLYMYVIM